MADRPLPSGTVAFLFTDIEGSTRRWERDRPAMAAALARHDALLRYAIEAHGGAVFKTVGDAFCAGFPTAPAALAAALAAQRALASEPWGEAGPIRVRMALHVGAAEERDADYFGPAVNRAARLLAAGHGGQVLLSQAAAQLVHDDLQPAVALRDLGEHRLKDLARPERVFQVVAPDLPADFPPLATLDRLRHNLPISPTPFVGREREAAAVRALLDRPDVRLVTLSGPGGAGKSRLALQVAAELADAYADGAWFVPLEEATDAERVAAAIARALGVREEPGQSPTQSALDAVRTKALLLVLDNFEQVVTQAAPFISDLLDASPRTKALVSSRVRLGLRSEQEYPVPPLGLPPSSALAPDSLLGFEAIRLFVARAQAAKPDFALTPDNAAEVAELCRRLDGLPLALELAAAWVKFLPPRALLRRLADALGLLVGGERDRPARQRTLRGTISCGVDLLTQADRTLFARLAVFAGGFDLAAAEAVANPDGDLDVLGGLAVLVNHSLVQTVEATDGEPRFALLATVREYAAERLEQAGDGEEERARHRHAAHFLALAEQAETEGTGSDQVRWLARLAVEHDNFLAALAWADAVGEADLALRLAGALGRFWEVRGHLSEGRRWLEASLARSSDASAARARALGAAGTLAYRQGDYDRAATHFEDALALRRALGDPAGITRSLTNLGNVARARGEVERAAALFGEAVAQARVLKDRTSLAACLTNLGLVASERGEAEQAVALLEEALGLYRSLGERQGLAAALTNLGNVDLERGEAVRAAARYDEALAFQREVGDRAGIARSLTNLGFLAHDQGESERAAALFGESLAQRLELGDTWGIAAALDGLAAVAAACQRPTQAARLARAAAAQRGATGAYVAPREQAGGSAEAEAWNAEPAPPLDDAVAEALALVDELAGTKPEPPVG